MRDTYPVETTWAPRWVGDELRQVRRGAADAHRAAARAHAEASAARSRSQPELCTRQLELARSYEAMEAAYRQRETVFSGVMADRADWEQATASQRRLAVAADAELRRRHPGQHFEPLRSAEPAPVTEAEHDDLAVVPAEQIGEMSQWIKELAAQRKAFADKLGERNSMQLPAEHPDYQDLGPAFPAWASPDKDAVLQPPKPPIPPAARVMQRVAGHNADMEAGN